MKKTIITLIAVCMLSAFGQTAMAQKAKFGHVDFAAIIQEQPETKDAETVVQNLKADLTTTGEAMQAELYKMMEDYQAKESSYTNAQKQLEQQKFNELRDKFEKFQEDAQEQLYTKQQELLTPIKDKVLKAVEEVAKSGNYTYVFDVTTPLFHSDSTDLTEAVKAKLNAGK